MIHNIDQTMVNWILDNFKMNDWQLTYANSGVWPYGTYNIEFKNPEDEIMCRLKFNV